jgi:dTDP-glucose 4,6-dehydratase
VKILVTGGAGFIGSNFVIRMLADVPDCRIVNFDALTYAGNLENLRSVERDPRYEFVRGDVADPGQVEAVFTEDVDAVVHFAAESHVDRSLEGAGVFLQTNVLGTQVLLEQARRIGVHRFVMVSTDEVYGSLGATGRFTEDSPLAPNSPYSASKASADLLCRAYHHSFRLPVMVTRCSNNYGPFQFPEKLIPLMIGNALHDEPLPVYGDGKNVRDWLHVYDHCAALRRVLEAGEPGGIYNIGGNSERENLVVVKTILEILGKPPTLIQFVTDRPGHDRRYAIDAGHVRATLGWEPEISFEAGIAQTVQWYLDHQSWLDAIRSGAYREYYERMYGSRGRLDGSSSS